MKCENCGNEFEGNFCPECGTPVNKNTDQKAPTQNSKKKKKPNGCLTIVLTIFIVVVVVSAIGSLGGNNSGSTTSTATSSSEPAAVSQDTATSSESTSSQPTESQAQEPSVSVSNMQAYLKAIDYLDSMPFSASGLVDQLEYEGFTEAEAQEAVDALNVDWNEQALLKAKDYLDSSAFSYTSLKEQLEYEGYTTDQATYGVDNCGADWMEQAALRAKQYLDSSAFSRSDLIWRYWCENMDGDVNPVDLVKLPQGLPQKQRRAPTDEEVDLIRRNPQGFGLCASFMLYAGLRLGEVMALQKRDITATSVKVTKAVVWHSNSPVIETPKTKNAVRTVPLLAPLREAIGNRLDSLEDDDYIFGGASPLTKSAYENAWLQYCAGLGLVHDTGQIRATGKTDKSGKALSKPIMAADFTAHQLRHEFATVLVRCGISVQVAKDIMGHADILTTQRWYAEAKEKDIEDAAEKLNSYYGRDKVV